ncbi:MAG: hypothetical protein WDN30_15595, partial [Pararobbsia sp.]
MRPATGARQHTRAQISLLLSLQVGVPLLGIDLDLPLYINAASATANLTRTQCGAGVNDSGSFMTVQPALANLCLAGQAAAMFATPPNATLPNCASALEIAQVTPVIRVFGAAATSLEPASSTVAFTGVGHTIRQPNPVVTSSNAVGQDVSSGISTLLNSLLSTAVVSLAGLNVSLSTVQWLLGPIVDIITNTLAPLLGRFASPVAQRARRPDRHRHRHRPLADLRQRSSSSTKEQRTPPCTAAASLTTTMKNNVP